MKLKICKILIIVLYCFFPLIVLSENIPLDSNGKPGKKIIPIDLQKMKDTPLNSILVLELQTDKEVYRPCEPIILSLKAKNISNNTVSINIPSRLWTNTFEIHVLNETKMENALYTNYGNTIHVDPTKNDPDISNKILSSEKTISIISSNSYTKKIYLNRIFDMSLSASYIISSSMILNDYSNSFARIRMESKPIKIKIEEDNSLTQP